MTADAAPNSQASMPAAAAAAATATPAAPAVTAPVPKRPGRAGRYLAAAIGFARFLPFAKDAAMDRMRRTGAKAFVRDLPTLVRLGFNYYRGTRSGLALADIEAPLPVEPYDAWQRVNRWSAADRDELVARLAACPAPLPKLSVVTPVYNPQAEFLEEMIASVAGQVYGDWELCLADDKSTDPRVADILHRWAAKDPRIKVAFREENGNISRATNTAAELASGEFIVFVDHDDLLTPDALGELALCAAAHPEWDFVYSDSDKIGPDGKRYHPEFKPDYSPELLLSYMYFTHVCMVRHELFRRVGGVRAGFEGAQDHDFALRAVEQGRHVGHVPLVLYHWRAAPGSTAVSGAAKPLSFDAGRRAVQEALDRRGIRGTAAQPDWALSGGLGIFTAEFPDDGPSVSLLIPTKNRLSVLKKCIRSLRKTTYKNYQVVIVDNESDDEDALEYFQSIRSAEHAAPHRVLRVSTGGRFSFASVNNQAVAAVDTEYVLLLNNDTEVIDPQWLSRMMGWAQAPGVGVVGGRLLYPDGRVQHAGVVHGIRGLAEHAFKLAPRWDQGYLSYAKSNRNYSAVTAACLLTPRRLFLESGGFDEKRFAVAYNDVDYGYRAIDAGLRCVYAAGAELYHHEGVSRGFTDDPREVVAFRRKYPDRVDRYYSPHLSLDDERFRIRPRRLPRAPVRRLRTLVFSHMMNFTGGPLIQYEVTRRLTETGAIEPVVMSIADRDGPLTAEYRKLGVEVVILPEHPLAPVLSAPATYDAAMRQLGERFRSLGADLLYANTLDSVFAVEAAKQVGLPSVWNVHESEGWQPFFNQFGALIAPRCRECFRYPYRVIFGSRVTSEVYRAWNSEHNFTVIHNPVAPDRLQAGHTQWTKAAARESLGVGEDEVCFLSLGTVCDRKGQIDLIHALQRIPAEHHDRMRAFIVGDRKGAYSDTLHEAHRKMPASIAGRTHFVTETDDVARYYRAADLFVCTSRVECYPRVTQEAMAFGLPIVTTAVYGIPEQVRPGVNAIFYEPGNIDHLGHALLTMVNDEDRRRAMARRSRDVLASLESFEQACERYAEVFREAYLSGRT